ncbi:MAG TPA: hypothetical protein VN200_07160 [Rhodoglobus sp.]|nr:hypothetical protein [Rhodoglobus sp.]
MSRIRLLISCVTAGYLLLLVWLTFMPSADGRPPASVWMLVGFAPVGALLVLLLGSRRWWSAAGFGVLGAAWVEAAQTIWLPIYASGWDVLMGGAGVVLGVAIGYAALGLRRRSMRSHGTSRIIAQAGMREIPRAE